MSSIKKRRRKTYFGKVSDVRVPGFDEHARLPGFVRFAEDPRGFIPSAVIVSAAVDGARETYVVNVLFHRCCRQRTSVVIHHNAFFPGGGGGDTDVGDGIPLASTLFAVAATHVSTTRQISYTCRDRPCHQAAIAG